MGAMRRGLSGLGVALLGLSGCWTTWWSTQPQMKPPPAPPEYILPPADDPRFSQPVAYPDKVLNEGLQKKESLDKDDMGIPGGMTGPRMRNAPGGPMGGGPGMY